MSDQLDIFGNTIPLALAPRVRSTDPQTSVDAALALDLNRRCRQVLRCIASRTYRPPRVTFTDGDLAGWMGEDRNIVARRRKDLTDVGLVEPVYRAGRQETRPGRRGRDELVWMLTDRGREVAAALTEETV